MQLITNLRCEVRAAPLIIYTSTYHSVCFTLTPVHLFLFLTLLNLDFLEAELWYFGDTVSREVCCPYVAWVYNWTLISYFLLKITGSNILLHERNLRQTHISKYLMNSPDVFNLTKRAFILEMNLVFIFLFWSQERHGPSGRESDCVVGSGAGDWTRCCNSNELQ